MHGSLRCFWQRLLICCTIHAALPLSTQCVLFVLCMHHAMQTLLATNTLAQIQDCYMLKIAIFYHPKIYLLETGFTYEK